MSWTVKASSCPICGQDEDNHDPVACEQAVQTSRRTREMPEIERPQTPKKQQSQFAILDPKEVQEVLETMGYAIGIIESMPWSMRDKLEDILDEDIDFELLNRALRLIDKWKAGL